jgi:TRAP-type C4-dicarboxylate transport system substrate-binding protein
MELFLQNELINNSAVARKLGISPSNLKMKLAGYKKHRYAKLTTEQRAVLLKILKELRRDLTRAINDETEKMQRRAEYGL